MTRFSKTIFIAGCLVVSFTIALCIGEIIMRIRGFPPMERDLGLLVVPRQARMYNPDPDLGYTLVPNQKITITHTRKMGNTSAAAPHLELHHFLVGTSNDSRPQLSEFGKRNLDIWLFVHFWVVGKRQ